MLKVRGKMRRVYLNDLTNNMIVSRNVVNGDGRVLLRAGMRLDENYINRLKELEIQSIIIYDEVFGEAYAPDIICEETRVQTVKFVKDSFKQMEKKKNMNTQVVNKVVSNLIDEILASKDVLINLSTISTFDDFIFNHSVGVCITSLMMGVSLGFSEQKLRLLGVGALLHDIGKVEIDKDIIRREGALSKEEYEKYKKHTEYGFEILRYCENISIISAHVAYQHHERWDGKGYPRMLNGTESQELSRIVAVANMFDEMMADLPNRPPFAVNQAVNLLKRMSGIHFEPLAVNALLSNIALYPVGSLVLLSTGQIGIVVEVNKNMSSKPVVRIAYNSSKQQVQSYEVDLSGTIGVSISEVLSEKDLNKILNNAMHD